jgi:hypothetical protein
MSIDAGNGEYATGIPYKPPVDKKPSGPETPCLAYTERVPEWEMVDAMWGGTSTMQAAGRTYLPQDPGESNEAFATRLERSIFFNAFKRTVQMLVGKPFSKPIKFSNDMKDADLKEWFNDIDRQGHHVDVFLKDAFRDQVRDGIVIFLVDYPRVTEEKITVAEKQRRGIRPYIVKVDPRNLLFWKTEVIDGQEKLTQVRIREIKVEADGEWGEKTTIYIRVYRRVEMLVDVNQPFGPTEPGVMWQLYRRDDDGERPVYTLVEDGQLLSEKNERIPEIPIVAAYAEQVAVLESNVPLKDLMELNLDHWRSSSDQRHILHVARVPIKFAKGFIPGAKAGSTDVPAKINLGPDRVVATENDKADFKYVEPPAGTAIDSGRTNLEDIKIEMAVLGAEKLVKKTVFSTATEQIHDNTAEDSELSAMARSLEDAFLHVMQFMFVWTGKDPKTTGTIEINKEFGIFPWQIQILANLLNLWAQGGLSHTTLIEEFKRLGALSDVLNVDLEVKVASAEFAKKQETQLAAKTKLLNAAPAGPGPNNQAGA